MMYPILCKVQYEKLHETVFKTREVWVQLCFSIVINWIIAPLVMVSPEVSLPTVQQNPGANNGHSSVSPGLSSPTNRASVRVLSLSALRGASLWF
jgi:hypothetical protein